MVDKPKDVKPSGPSTEEKPAVSKDVKTSEEEIKEESPKPEEEKPKEKLEEKTPGEEPGPEKPKKESEQPKKPVPYSRFQEKIEEVNVLKRKVKDLEATSTPSDEELTRKYPDWDIKDEEEKQRIRDEEEREKRIRKLEEDKAWGGDFKSLVKKEKFSSLGEREEEFREYVYDKDPGNKLDLETMAKSFLFEEAEDIGAKEEKEKKKKKGLETPVTTPTQPSTGEYTLEDIKNLRENEPKKYEKLLREGRIKKIPTE